VKLELFIPVGVFLAVALPLVWLLNALEVGGEYRVWIAIGAGAIATGWAQSRLAAKAEQAEKAANEQNKPKNREQQA
jgi:hypothetical protein